jgi:hypothetical protein
MASQLFFWICVGIGASFLVLFLFPRSYQGPSRLRMWAGKRASRMPVVKKNAATATVKSDFSTISRETREAGIDGRAKILNVMFNYNGHAWDAHEVLGIPAGAPMDMVTGALQKMLKETDPSSHDFLKTAYHAIKSGYR